MHELLARVQRALLNTQRVQWPATVMTYRWAACTRRAGNRRCQIQNHSHVWLRHHNHRAVHMLPR